MKLSDKIRIIAFNLAAKNVNMTLHIKSLADENEESQPEFISQIKVIRDAVQNMIDEVDVTYEDTSFDYPVGYGSGTRTQHGHRWSVDNNTVVFVHITVDESADDRLINEWISEFHSVLDDSKFGKGNFLYLSKEYVRLTLDCELSNKISDKEFIVKISVNDEVEEKY